MADDDKYNALEMTTYMKFYQKEEEHNKIDKYLNKNII